MKASYLTKNHTEVLASSLLLQYPGNAPVNAEEFGPKMEPYHLRGTLETDHCYHLWSEPALEAFLSVSLSLSETVPFK